MNADSEALQSGQRRRHFLLLGPVNLFSFYRVPKIHVSDTNPGRRLVSWPMGVKAERIPWVWKRDLIVTPASFKSRYPLSVFNVNSTLKDQLVSMIQERVTRIHSTAKLRHVGDPSDRGACFLRSYDTLSHLQWLQIFQSIQVFQSSKQKLIGLCKQVWVKRDLRAWAFSFQVEKSFQIGKCYWRQDRPDHGREKVMDINLILEIPPPGGAPFRVTRMKRGRKHIGRQKIRKCENAQNGLWRKSLWRGSKHSLNAEAFQSGQNPCAEGSSVCRGPLISSTLQSSKRYEKFRCEKYVLSNICITKSTQSQQTLVFDVGTRPVLICLHMCIYTNRVEQWAAHGPCTVDTYVQLCIYVCGMPLCMFFRCACLHTHVCIHMRMTWHIHMQRDAYMYIHTSIRCDSYVYTCIWE